MTDTTTPHPRSSCSPIFGYFGSAYQPALCEIRRPGELGWLFQSMFREAFQIHLPFVTEEVSD